MLICIPGIMHTGNHLFRHEIFPEPEFKPWSRLIKMQDGQKYKYFTHVDDGSMPLLESIIEKECDLLICPMRHPARVLQSFIDRQRSIYDGVNAFTHQWINMQRLFKKYDPLFIHIDIENRNKQLQAIGHKLFWEFKLNLQCTWPVHRDLSGAVYGNHDLKITAEMRNRVPYFILDFYHEVLGELYV